MHRGWHRLQSLPIWLRWPIKWLILAAVVFLVLYPNPAVFVRHVRHLRMLDTLPDPNEPALAEVARRFDAFLAEQKRRPYNNWVSWPPDTPAPRSPDSVPFESAPGPGDGDAILAAAETFVCQEVSYAWDWDTWGVADYVPTLAEVIARRAEDCDGRAVLAAALLRARGLDAQLAAGAGHCWVRTPQGDTMGPIGEPTVIADREGLHMDWAAQLQIKEVGPLAYGVSVFPMRRELIILATLWLLLLSPGTGRLRAAGGLFLLLEGLVVVRLAGVDAVAPRYGAIAWGLLHVPASMVVLSVGVPWRRRGPRQKNTDRSAESRSPAGGSASDSTR